MLHLTERLLKVEDEFLAALGNDEGAMCAFESRWEKLLEDVDVAASSPAGLDCDTASLVHTIAIRVATLAEASTTIVMDYEAITSQLIDDIDCLMSELTLSDFLPANAVQPLALDGSSARSGSAQPTQPCRKRRRDSAMASPKGIKRSRLESDPVDQGYEQSRSSVHRVPCKSPLSLPSTSLPPTAMNHANMLPNAKQTSRKRRLSDADLLIPPRPKRLHVGPRLHAVSDSFLPSSTHAPPLFPSNPSCTEFASTIDLQQVPLSGMLDIQPLIGSVDMDPTLQVPRTVFPGLEETDSSQQISPDLDELLRTWLYSTHSSSILPNSVPIGAGGSCDPLGVDSQSTPVHTQPVSPRSPSSTASTPPPATPPSLHTILDSNPPIHHLDPLLFSDISSSFASLMDSPVSHQLDVDPFWCGAAQTVEHNIVLPSAGPAWCSKPFTCGAPDTSRCFIETFGSIPVDGYVEPDCL